MNQRLDSYEFSTVSQTLEEQLPFPASEHWSYLSSHLRDDETDPTLKLFLVPKLN